MTNFEEIKRKIANMNIDELIEFCGGDTCENVLCAFVRDGDCCGNNCKVSYDCGGCIKKFYISDWHYGHANVIAFDNRPFKSLLEMDEALVDRWNAVVSPGDIVYVLGDMFWCKAQDAIPILRSLKGQKFLIKGNHDRCNDNKFLREFVKVTEYLEVKDSGRTVILCHYPIPCFKNHFYGSFHLYGHVHNSFEWNMMEHDKYLMEELYTTPCQMFNVGAMMPWMDYTPRTLDEIIAANSHNEAVRNK